MPGMRSKKRSKSVKAKGRSSHTERQETSSSNSDEPLLKKRLRASTQSQTALQQSRGFTSHKLKKAKINKNDNSQTKQTDSRQTDDRAEDDAGVADRTRRRIEFCLDLDKMNKALNEFPLGEIKVIDDGELGATVHPVLSKTIDCRTDSDTRNVEISDVLSMNIENKHVLVVADSNNHCVKSFFTRDNKPCHSRLDLGSSPRRIAKLEDNKLAVTLTDHWKIVTVRITPYLSLLSSIHILTPQYYGLAALTSTTLVASCPPLSMVDVLDLNGNTLRSLNGGRARIVYPHFLCTASKGNILMSDEGDKSVYCLTPQGEEVFKYSPTGDRALESPYGITCTDTGDILFVDLLRNRVTQLDETGQFVRDVLTESDGIKSPYAIDYDDKGRIYVSHENGSIQEFTVK